MLVEKKSLKKELLLKKNICVEITASTMRRLWS